MFWRCLLENSETISNQKNSSAIPTLAKVKFALNFTTKVWETESARTLFAKMDEVIDNVQKILDYAKKKTMTLCILMEREAAGIMAKHNVESYDVHQAVLDFKVLGPDKVM